MKQIDTMKTKEQTRKTGKDPFRRTGILRNSFLAAITLLWGISSSLQAQTTEPLHLNDAVKYALEANQNARKAKLDIENGQYQIDEVKARALPQITGNAGLTYNAILPLSALPGELAGQPGTTLFVAFGQKWNSNFGLSVTQTLFDNSVFVGLKAAKTTAEFYRINSQLTEEQIIEQVATTYYQVLVQRQQMSVLDSTIRNTQRMQDVLEQLYKSGLAKKIDVDRNKVNVINLKSRKQQLTNGESLLVNQLKFYMGMPIQESVYIPDEPLDKIKPQAVPKDEVAEVSGRTEMKVLATQQKLLSYQKESVKSTGLPTLSFNGNYAYSGLGNKFPYFKGLGSGVNWFDVASLGLNLKVPIFTGGSTKAKVKQADIALRKLNEDISSTRLALNLAFENAKTQINNSIITLNTQKENVELARQVYENTTNNYQNGLATLTDLLNAENSLTDAQNNYSSALLSYKVAEIQLIKAQGNLRSLLNREI